MEDIRERIESFILEEFLPGERPDVLTDTTPLATGGILDSIGIFKLLAFLEKQYGVEVAIHEATIENLNTIADITALINAKLAVTRQLESRAIL